MGELTVKPIRNQEERFRFIQRLLSDIRAMDSMIENKQFEKNHQRIGAEQEIALIDDDYNPALNGPELLDLINDPHFTTEIARFNLEINLDPYELRSDAFRQTERQLRKLLNLGQSRASDEGSQFLLTGILPTIQYGHLDRSYMTPRPRYRVLSDAIHNIRGSNFEIHIEGVEDIIYRLDSVMFEACNTSFQLHLQIDPDDFPDQYNWAQAIAGPLLSCCTNSPLLFGRELWMETRIALFQQSIDTRSSANHLRKKQRRVRFGNNWVMHSATELFKDQIARFPLILTTDIQDDAMDELAQGRIPTLPALRLQNGTVYTWNRPCYGISDTGFPHLRIENRYIPSGPTVCDEMANFAFWVGLMKGLPAQYRRLPGRMPYDNLVDNFYRAARNGLDSVFDWFGKATPADRLILDELLPIARDGLEQARVNSSDIDRYLQVIERRVSLRRDGSRWQVDNFRRLRERYGVGLARTELTRAMLKRQQTSEPVHTWSDLDPGRIYSLSMTEDTVYKIMSSDLFTVREDEPLAFVKSIMEWKKIRHLPVEDSKGELVGLVTHTNLRAFSTLSGGWEKLPIRQFMIKKLITVPLDTPISSAVKLMDTYSIGCLPVVNEHKLVGLVTDTDLKRLEKAEVEGGVME